jgi:hypothetical protein
MEGYSLGDPGTKPREPRTCCIESAAMRRIEDLSYAGIDGRSIRSGPQAVGDASASPVIGPAILTNF